MTRFDVFRWIAVIGAGCVGLAACSSGADEPTADTSAIAPIEESVPPPSTTEPVATTTSTTAPTPTTTSTPPSTAAPTTTTDPYDGRFTDEQVAAIDGYIAAEIAYRRAQVDPWSTDAMELLRQTHHDGAYEDRADRLIPFRNGQYETWFTSGIEPSAVIYSARMKDDGDVVLVLCINEDRILRENGETTLDVPWALGWQATMTPGDSGWTLRGASPLDSRENEQCPAV